MKKAIVADIIVLLLVILFIYSSFNKYFDFANFSVAMHNQPFTEWLANLLIWFLPSLELLIAALLVFEKTQRKGLLASMVILILFTGYILLILAHIFPRVPCSCGGVIKSLSWTGHLFFNLFFLTISVIAYYLKNNNTNINQKNISRAKSG